MAYPYNSSVVTVSVDLDYLLDVVPQEMSPSFPQEALNAQAAAARSYAYYQNLFLNPTVPFNNSIQYQVFIPQRFESFGYADHNGSHPCFTDRLTGDQRKICLAVFHLDYMMYSYDQPQDPPFDPRPVFAEFGADLVQPQYTEASAPIVDLEGTVLYPYQHPFLQTVYDPISVDPVEPAAGDNFHGRGMSQNGAGRWAEANSAFPLGTEQWSVRLEKSAILGHYYTGVDFFELNSFSTITPTRKSEPDDRWAPLAIEWPAPINASKPQLEPNTSYDVTLTLQNIGVDEWACSQPINELQLRYAWGSGNDVVAGVGSAELCDVPRGQSIITTITIVTPNDEVHQLLQFDIHDVYLPTGQTIGRFSDPDTLQNSWEPYTQLATVGDPDIGSAFLPRLSSTVASSFVIVPTAVTLQQAHTNLFAVAGVGLTTILLFGLTALILLQQLNIAPNWRVSSLLWVGQPREFEAAANDAIE